MGPRPCPTQKLKWFERNAVAARAGIQHSVTNRTPLMCFTPTTPKCKWHSQHHELNKENQWHRATPVAPEHRQAYHGRLALLRRGPTSGTMPEFERVTTASPNRERSRSSESAAQATEGESRISIYYPWQHFQPAREFNRELETKSREKQRIRLRTRDNSTNSRNEANRNTSRSDLTEVKGNYCVLDHPRAPTPVLSSSSPLHHTALQKLQGFRSNFRKPIPLSCHAPSSQCSSTWIKIDY